MMSEAVTQTEVATSADCADGTACLWQDRIAQLEMNLEEERQSGDHLMDRIDRSREQVQQSLDICVNGLLSTFTEVHPAALCVPPLTS